MNAEQLRGTWNQTKGQLKKKWANLTEDDLRFRDGNIDEIVGRIQQRTGEARETIEAFLNDLANSGQSVVSQAAQAVAGGASQAGDRLREHFGQVADQANYGYDQARDYVRSRPTQSVATVFGVGLGIGLLIGLMIRPR